jgi:hypothetical protein
VGREETVGLSQLFYKYLLAETLAEKIIPTGSPQLYYFAIV